MTQSLVELNRISSEGKPVTIPSMVGLGMIRSMVGLGMISSKVEVVMIPIITLEKTDLILLLIRVELIPLSLKQAMLVKLPGKLPTVMEIT